MTVFVLTACPDGLRGHLTRWMLEIAPGVFVGNVNKKIRDFLWQQVKDYSQKGRAIMAYGTNNEQGLAFDTWYHNWSPVDHDGMTLIRRKEDKALMDTLTQSGLISPDTPVEKTRFQGTGLSKVSQRRKYSRR